jgi:hypothetical protein
MTTTPTTFFPLSADGRMREDREITHIEDALDALRAGETLGVRVADMRAARPVQDALEQARGQAFVGEWLAYGGRRAAGSRTYEDGVMTIRLERAAPAVWGACSFCGTLPGPGRRHINGRGGIAICADCVALCNEILADETTPPL